jgi:hypothetical protein
MRDRRANKSRLVVSAQKRETALNTEQVLCTLFLLEMSDILKSGKLGEKDAVLAGGPSEPEKQFIFGGSAEGPITFNKMQPQHLGFLAAYGLGDVTTVAAGGGYLHTIKPLLDPVDAGRDVPTFTAVQQLGTILKRLFTSMAVDSFTLSFAKNDWVKCSGSLRGTGKTQLNLIMDSVAGFSDDATVTLTANAVEGADAAARLDSIHSVRFTPDAGGGAIECYVKSASDATPAEIGIEPPDSSGHNAGTYEIDYVPVETASLDTGSATADPEYDHANRTSKLTDSAATMTPDEHIGRWLVMTSGTATGRFFQIADNTATEVFCDGYNLYAEGVRSADTYKIVQYGWLPIDQAKVSEPAMRANSIEAIVGGDYNGSSFTGGRRLGGDANSVEWTYSNNLEAGFKSDAKDYANAMDRTERSQELRLDRELKDAVYQALMERRGGAQADEAPYFAVRIAGEGPEYEAGYTFYWEVIFPRCALLNPDPGLDGQKLVESMQVSILAHPDHGSVIVRVRNEVASYAA